MTAPLDYIRDPREIYARSFVLVRRATPVSRFPSDIADLVIRIVHATGDPDLADDVVYSGDAVAAGREALASGARVLCDCEMVSQGIIRRALPQRVAVRTLINDPRTPEKAVEIANTRSAAAVDLWLPELKGAIVAIGNAPTALFRLLEHLDAGAPRPALILAFPVGFVGATESKAELAGNPRQCSFITVSGRRGGSAMAAAAVNALSLGLGGDGL